MAVQQRVSLSRKDQLHLKCWSVYLLLTALYLTNSRCCAAAVTSSSPLSSVLVVGSVNMDVIMEVHRLPGKGETTTSRSPGVRLAVGGKGANQAVAAARLSGATGRSCRFICRFGNDSYAAQLQQELVAAGVEASGCSSSPDLPSGLGMVMLEADGAVSSVVLGGANTAWPQGQSMDHLLEGVGVVLLQREIPEHVNMAVAEAAARAGVPVLQDIGGEDRPLPAALLPLLEYVAPNESELQRITNMPTDTQEQVVSAARSLLRSGAHHVLVTLAERGALLVSEGGGFTHQPPLPVPGGTVVDATAAGDAFRAAFAVALVEGRTLPDCLQFAAAAGAATVAKMGAVPSLPTRVEVEEIIAGYKHRKQEEEQQQEEQQSSSSSSSSAAAADLQPPPPPVPAPAAAATLSSTSSSNTCATPPPTPTTLPPAAAAAAASGPCCPLKFASRLNSMRSRRDLLSQQPGGGAAGRPDAGAGAGAAADDVVGWIARQARVVGLQLVDFNYPQHFEGVKLEQVESALAAAGLSTGAICIRFPDTQRAGAFTNPDQALRRQALSLAVEGCQLAADLGASQLIVWSPYDGYDYHFQVDYPTAWQHTVAAFQHLADSCPPGVKVSLEFKPTDAASRFSIVHSTGSALLLAQQVNRPNFGLTLDLGHLLMAGENPAQSVAMVGQAGKLFGLQLNDAHVKLGAEDGLAFGSVSPIMALEVVRWLQRVDYSGHVYFDTFPVNEDPVREAEYNIRRFKALWARAYRLGEAGVDGFALGHDAMGVLEMLEEDEQIPLHWDCRNSNNSGTSSASSGVGGSSSSRSSISSRDKRSVSTES